MSDPILAKKRFPNDYPKTVVNVINSMSMDRGKGLQILGSNSIKALKYSQDYDLYQKCDREGIFTAEAITYFVAEFKAIIRELMKKKNVYIGDIKSGNVPEWEVIPVASGVKDQQVYGYQYLKASEKLDELFSKQVITKEEYDDARSYLKPNPTPEQFLEMKDNIKYNVVRWKPKDIMNGYVIYRGKRYNLENGFNSKSITKMDVVALVDGAYCDFSCIYEFRNNGRRLNGLKIDNVNSLKCDLIFFINEGKYFKVAKRMFSLASQLKNVNLLNQLEGILNDHDMGSLYVVMGHITTLLWMLENESSIPIKRMEHEFSEFKTTIKDIDELKSKLKERRCIEIINKLHSEKNRTKMESLLGELVDIISRAVNGQAEKSLKKINMLPLPTTLKP